MRYRTFSCPFRLDDGCDAVRLPSGRHGARGVRLRLARCRQDAIDSINSSDYAPVLAVVLLSALTYLVVYLVTDILHFVIDPRTRT